MAICSYPRHSNPPAVHVAQTGRPLSHFFRLSNTNFCGQFCLPEKTHTDVYFVYLPLATGETAQGQRTRYVSHVFNDLGILSSHLVTSSEDKKMLQGTRTFKTKLSSIGFAQMWCSLVTICKLRMVAEAARE